MAGTSRLVDRSGFENKWISIINYSHSTSYENKKGVKIRYHYWTCFCKSCENTFVCTFHNLKNERQKSCGCLNHKLGDSNKGYKGYKELTGRYYRALINGAKSRNIEFRLSLDYLWDLYIQQNRKCALTGLDINFYRYKEYNKQDASLDRINNDLGYIKGNVQWVHKHINIMKWKFKEEYFKSLCKLVAEEN